MRLGTSSHEPGLLVASLSTSVPLSTSTPSQPPPTVSGSSNEAIQPRTILLIVIGLVGFVILILGASLLSRLTCLHRQHGDIPMSARSRLRPNPWVDGTPSGRTVRNSYRNTHPRSLYSHVEPTIYPEFGVLTVCDDLPPYWGPSVPTYHEAMQYHPQPLHPPPTAVHAA